MGDGQIAQFHGERVTPLAHARKIDRRKTERVNIRGHGAATAVHVRFVVHHDADAVGDIRLLKGAEALRKANGAADALFQFSQLIEKLHAASFSTTNLSSDCARGMPSKRLSLTSVSVR